MRKFSKFSATCGCGHEQAEHGDSAMKKDDHMGECFAGTVGKEWESCRCRCFIAVGPEPRALKLTKKRAHKLTYTKLDGKRVEKVFPALERLERAVARAKVRCRDEFNGHDLKEVITPI